MSEEAKIKEIDRIVRKQKKKNRYKKHVTAEPGNMDKSERFVFCKCAAYMERQMTVCPLVDRETIEVLAWILGPEMTAMWKCFLKGLTDRDKERYTLETDIDLAALENIPESMTIILSHARKNVVAAFIDKCRDALNSRQTALAYKGQSDTEKRIKALSKMFSLSAQEISLVEFIYTISVWQEAEDYFVDHLHCQNMSGRRHLKTIIKMTDREITAALTGTLAKIDFYEIDRCSFSFNDDFMEFFQKPSGELPTKNYFTRFSRKTIPLDNHMVDPSITDHILNLLQTKRESSNHILLYGSPGTGKTSYALGLMKKLGIPAYEISQEEWNHSRNRRAAILACLNMTNAGDGSLIIVDEADNLLNTKGAWFARGETQDKGWLNQLLEERGVRMIWITNDITSIEQSVMRRFAFSVHFPDFNRRQRISLWDSILRRHHVRRYFNDDAIKILAVRYPMSAAIIDLAVRKARESSPSNSKNLQAVVEMNLKAHLRLLNNGEKPKTGDKIENNYSIDGLNIEGNLPAIMKQLEAFDRRLREPGNSSVRNFNLLFYGPPGAGKSELARYIAKHLDRELMVKRASDIVGPYVGETEQNISSVFSEAEALEAVLVIDEVDSFLFSRDRAVRSWEISHTNEFLTQMERFKGILICTTNRFEDLDSASVRRFNHKIGFRCLTQDGNGVFYKKLLSGLSRVSMSRTDEELLLKIRDLTPGDFRIVRDRFEILEKANVTHEGMIQALEEEARIKKSQHGNKPIGFMRCNLQG